ncbi:subtilase family protein [Sarocladium implicatum]|nr:subtilase family protein [Sarocladium implicatum]
MTGITTFLTAVPALLATLVAGAAVPRDAKDGSMGILGLPIINYATTSRIPNRYIVMYNESYDDVAVTANMAHWTAEVQKRNLNKRGEMGHLLSTNVRSASVGKWRCMALDADDAMIADIYNSPEVAYVEADTYVNTTMTIAQTNAPIGLDRLSSAQAGQDSNYVFDANGGQGITVYVVDTGVRASHVEFEGRATLAANFADNVNEDVNGHGSHVAGTIAGATFGVAKKADIVGVKVLGGDGGGSTSGVIDGMNFVGQQVQAKNQGGKAVLNMSLGGQASNAMNQMISALTALNIVCVVAAGNEFADTINTSPGSAEQAITVGAIDPRNDEMAPFSNFGTPVDIFAPGVDILSVGIQNDQATNVLSGTSMASPHVAGLAAYIMSLTGETDPVAIKNQMAQLATGTGAQVLPVQGTNANFFQQTNTTRLIANNGFRM